MPTATAAQLENLDRRSDTTMLLPRCVFTLGDDDAFPPPALFLPFLGPARCPVSRPWTAAAPPPDVPLALAKAGDSDPGIGARVGGVFKCS